MAGCSSSNLIGCRQFLAFARGRASVWIGRIDHVLSVHVMERERGGRFTRADVQEQMYKSS